MISQAETHRIAVNLRNRFANGGWTTGSYKLLDGKVCFVGGLTEELGFTVSRSQICNSVSEVNEVMQAVRAFGFIELIDAVQWNDRHHSPHHIIQKLDEVIAKTAPEPEDPVREEPVECLSC